MRKSSKTIGKVTLALERLAGDMPFHAGIVSRWRLMEDGDITETMAIGFRSGRFVLYANPNFVCSLSMDELGAVLSHEVGHVLFGHVYHEPPPMENRQARIVAEETVVNDWAIGPLPGRPILTSDYDVLSLRQDTEERYYCLKDIVPESCVLVGIDDHAKWEQIYKNGGLAKLTGTFDASVAWSKLTPTQQKAIKMPPAVQKRLEACGALDGSGSEPLETGAASVPWQTVLRRYVGREFRRTTTFSRPSRRFPDLVGIIPGTSRQCGKPHVMAVIDTSASMTAKLLADISSELGAMARAYTVTVVECDKKIHAVYAFKPIESVSGRGGTDLRPPFEADFQKQLRPDLLAYFTDGHGPAPDTVPSIPVLWCLTPKGKMPCAWGREVRLG